MSSPTKSTSSSASNHSGFSDSSESSSISGVSALRPRRNRKTRTSASIDPTAAKVPNDKSDIADLVAQYGTSSATAWLEFDQYKIWRPETADTVPQSSFLPVQGYMRKDPWVFAWGNPLVSDPSALEPTALAFSKWVQSHDLKPVWCCVNDDLLKVLSSDPFNWSAVSCIVEDVLDPAHVVDLAEHEGTSAAREGNESAVKDLKKNLRRAAKAGVEVKEIDANDWTEEDKVAVEKGVKDWRKARHGIQLASVSLSGYVSAIYEWLLMLGPTQTSMQPWLDSEHRRYWVARKDGVVRLSLCSSFRFYPHTAFLYIRSPLAYSS